MRITPDVAITTFKNAQTTYASVLRQERSTSKLRTATYTFEDTLNGLTGEFAAFDTTTQNELKAINAALVTQAKDKSITVKLHSSLLPASQILNVTQQVTQTGKKLYPKTITFSTIASSSNTIYVTAANNTSNTVLVPFSQIIDDEAIDPLFDEIDAEPVTQEPLALYGADAEWTPLLSNDMIELAETVAANANGLQAGLTTFSHNPLESVIEDMRELLIYYTEGNYANLNVALSSISSNASLNVEYRNLRYAIGGVDGLSGCVAQLDAFRDHTDRLCGLVLDEDSPNAEPTGDSVTEYLNLYDISGGPVEIFRFNARRFRSAKYIIQATAASADRGHQVNELYILHDNHQAYTREIAAMYTQEPFVTFTTQLTNGNVRVLANTTQPNTDFVVHGTRLRVARSAESYADLSQSRIIENHSTLSGFLNDGVDYVRKQSGSLFNGAVVGNIAREMRDMILLLGHSSFATLSLPNASAAINSWAEIMNSRANSIQDSIETDYEEFDSARKLAESLTIAYTLSGGYNDPNANATLQSTLNSPTKDAILAEDE